MAVERVDIGFRPHRYQRDMIARAARFTVCVAHRRFGKTVGAAAIVEHAALVTSKPNARFGYIAPFLKQAVRIAWPYLKQFALAIPGVVIREGEKQIRFPNGAEIHVYGADNADAMRGLYFDGLVLDELADFRPDVWATVILPTLADRKGWAFIIGTPKGPNLLHELWLHAQVTPGWAALMYRVDETGLIDEAELSVMRESMSDAQYRQEFLCDFSAAADNVLITVDAVVDAQARICREPDIAPLSKIMGVDIARYGDDRSVIAKRQGPLWWEPRTFRGVDNMTLASIVAQEIQTWQPDAVFVDAGRGEGVIDRLRSLGHAPIEINFGGRASDPTYRDKRAEMYDLMGKHIREEAALPDCPELVRDLAAPTYAFDASGRMALERKELLKGRLGYSPDVGDAFALTYAQPVAPRRFGAGAGPQFVNHDFNPFEEA